ncbi:hypothetical protein EJ08DRAFT_677429 [Tothia fuscella]|uniref:Uncharacterized protein n=1 Tax=Tothia fuscella TaxID=1048955 RepID=A0A9P4U0I9_9PEZI|nr:hypothetical protein EJ08DRAFT_677429 [Tothia fuscella]
MLIIRAVILSSLSCHIAFAVIVIPMTLYFPKPYENDVKPICNDSDLLHRLDPRLRARKGSPTVVLESKYGLIGRSRHDMNWTDNIYEQQDSLVRGAIDASAKPQHLVLRPDDIWYTALTQFSFYMRAHENEKLIQEIWDNFDGRLPPRNNEWVLITSIMDQWTQSVFKQRDKSNWLLNWVRPCLAKFRIRSTANTNVLYFNGRLLACKEDSPPFSLDPETLETIGLEDFNGQLPSLTFTAHPKFDDDTKELLCFGYEAKGDGTPDNWVISLQLFHQLTRMLTPLGAVSHHPSNLRPGRMKQGGEHWHWDPNVPFYLGVLPRHGASGADVKWFRAPNAFPGHTINAYEDNSGNLVFDLPLTNKNVFFWWPDAIGNAPNPAEIAAEVVRFTLDPRSDNLDLPEPQVLSSEDCEFPRIDNQFSGKKHMHAFMNVIDPSLGTDFATIMPVMGGGHPPYNSLGHLDYNTTQMHKYFPGRTHLVQEPVFIPRSPILLGSRKANFLDQNLLCSYFPLPFRS